MNFKSIAFTTIIFILTLFVTIYGVDTFYSKPIYEDFCPNTLWETPIMNETACFEFGGKWINYAEVVDGKTGYCEKSYLCSEAYNLKSERYSLNIFLISIILGIIVFLLGFYLFNLEFVSLGIMFGGIGTILRGVGTYWQFSENWVKFVISLIGLIVLVYVAYKFNNKISTKKK